MILAHRISFSTRGLKEELLKEIYRYLSNHVSAEKILKELTLAPAGQAAVFVKALARRSETLTRTEIQQLLSHSNPKVRLIGIKSIKGVFGHDDAVEPLKRATLDPIAAIRATAFMELAESYWPTCLVDIKQGLLDPAAHVRDACRFAVSRHEAMNFAEFYKNALNMDWRTQATALKGLGETGHKEDAALALPYLESTIPRVRTAAYSAVGKLDPEQHILTFLKAYDDSSGKVRKLAQAVAKSHPKAIPLEWLEAIYFSSEVRIKEHLLALAAHLEKWDTLCLLLKFLSKTPAAETQGIETALKKWLLDFNSSFSHPSPDKLAAIQNLLSDARAKHPSVGLNKLEFYLP